MLINKNEEKKIIQIWMSHDDQNNNDTIEKLDSICNEYSKKKYKVAIFYSGKKDLFECMDGLVKNNLYK